MLKRRTTGASARPCAVSGTPRRRPAPARRASARSPVAPHHLARCLRSSVVDGIVDGAAEVPDSNNGGVSRPAGPGTNSRNSCREPMSKLTRAAVLAARQTSAGTSPAPSVGRRLKTSKPVRSSLSRMRDPPSQVNRSSSCSRPSDAITDRATRCKERASATPFPEMRCATLVDDRRIQISRARHPDRRFHGHVEPAIPPVTREILPEVRQLERGAKGIGSAIQRLVSCPATRNTRRPTDWRIASSNRARRSTSRSDSPSHPA